MTKDYAKRKNTHYPSKLQRRGAKANGYRHTKRLTSPLTWLFVGIFFGLLAAGILYWKLNQPILDKTTLGFLQPTATKTPSKKPLPQKTAEATRFDFYNLLPNMQVDVSDLNPEKNLSATTTQKESKSTPKTQNIARQKDTQDTIEAHLSTTAQLLPPRSDAVVQFPFIIQVASFKQPGQAESLKARLALNGFESKIQPIKIGANETWYRLYLGPFPDRISAQNTQKKLESEQKINSLVMKINV